jgi:hypothetical protein
MHPMEILEIYRVRDLAKVDGAVPPLFPADLYPSTKQLATLLPNKKKQRYNFTIKREIRNLSNHLQRVNNNEKEE